MAQVHFSKLKTVSMHSRPVLNEIIFSACKGRQEEYSTICVCLMSTQIDVCNSKRELFISFPIYGNDLLMKFRQIDIVCS